MWISVPIGLQLRGPHVAARELMQIGLFVANPPITHTYPLGSGQANAKLALDQMSGEKVVASLHVVAAVIRADGKYLCARRKPGKSMGGFWEFPGGKVETGEPPNLALERELVEELGLVVNVGEKLGETLTGNKPKIRLEFYDCEIPSQIELQSTDHDLIVWLPRENLLSLEWAPADLHFVQQLVGQA